MDLLHAYSKHLGRPDVAGLPALSAAQSRRSSATPRTANRPRRLREAEIDDLVSRYHATQSVNAVAREFRISRQTAAKHLASRGITTVRRMTEADIATAVQEYGQGDSAAAIGRRLGFDAQTILNRLSAVDISIRPRNGH